MITRENVGWRCFTSLFRRFVMTTVSVRELGSTSWVLTAKKPPTGHIVHNTYNADLMRVLPQ